MTRHSASIATACLCGVAATHVLAGAPSDNCDTESVQRMAPADTSVAFAAREGELCRVVGYVSTRDPGPNKVLFTLGLPNNFNGRYIYLGVGGAAGNLPPLRPELIAKGFAVSGSDGGTGAKHYSDFSFKSNPAKLADFRGRGVHVVAAATQQITRTYYNQPDIHRYISGCSGGGSMGIVNALRFGNQDFDGFVVGATPWPGHNAFKAEVFRLAQYLQTHPQAWISPELLKKADAAILAAYDATDGAVDGIIADQRNIGDFDLQILRKSGFSEPQIRMFDLVRKPSTFKLPDGRIAVQPGYSITNVASWSQYIFGTTPPPWPSTQSMSAEEVYAKGAPFFHVMADTNTRASNPTLDYAQVKDPAKLSLLALTAGGDSEFIADPDGAFAKFGTSGAKMIVYHGVNDQAMPYLETLKDYEELSQEHADIGNWMRVFTMPGLMHCRGGTGTTNSEEPLIDSLVSWVEKNQPPDTIIADKVTPAKGLERTFRLCAEPARAFLKKAGDDPAKAENWDCRRPDNQHQVAVGNHSTESAS